MGNRLYTAAVVVAWLAAMSWLVVDRILPPFFGGDAPATHPSNQREPVAWRIEMEERSVGQAVLQAVDGAGGTTEVHSFLRLDEIQSPKSAPIWMAPFLKSLNNVSFTMQTRTTYDPLNRLSSFATAMRLLPSDVPIKINGRIVAKKLLLTASVGEMRAKRFEHDWPGDGMLGNDLTPSGRLLPLYQGRRWSHEVFNPFGSRREPMELIEAVVTEPLRITQDGETNDAWRVEYRTYEKTGATEEGRLRMVLFVAADGRVLQQEAHFLGSRVTFYRLPDERSAELADELLDLATNATLTQPKAEQGPSANSATNATMDRADVRASDENRTGVETHASAPSTN